MKKTLMLIVSGILTALQLAAMPTAEEQKKAVPLVAELMNPLVADFKANKKTAAEVGDMAMSYVKEANTEAAKYLLMKGAIWYFAQANEDAKCIATLAALGEQVKDIPPEVMRNEVIKPAIDRLSEQNVPRLLAQFRLLSAQMEIAKLKPSVRRKRANASTCRRYAELLVITGDWRAARTVFAKLGDAKMAQIVKDEIAGKGLASAGDFWWEYKPKEDAATDAIKAHAAALYRKAIATGELTGLKKVVAEKRIASVPSTDSLDVSAMPRGGAPSNALYCVIDLSAGPNASKYPVSYLAAEPVGGFNTDEYKTTKLVLRRIEPGTFMMCGKYEVTLTKPFYCGIFEVTQKQYELVTGNNPSEYKGDMRPVEQISWNTIRGDSATYNWPSSVNVDSSTFIGKIQARTGFNFDLPTEAQWEYACRAGTTSEYNNGGNTEDDLKQLGRYSGNKSDGKGGYSDTHTMVGSYLPNAWELYDMHGNVNEWCLDWQGELSNGVRDPQGHSSHTRRVFRGACWASDSKCYPSRNRFTIQPYLRFSRLGFRLCMNPDSPVGSTPPRESGAPAASGKAPANALYCVIDLSAGPNASKYPVTEFDTPPSGGFNTDEYKTTKLALRRIEPGKFMMGGKYEVTLTKPFYCGIFEVTQKQYELVTGGNPSACKGDMRPVEQVSWNMVRGDSASYNWPSSANVDSSTFIGKIQARTGLNFDLPTEAQWEYACRAGTTSQYNNGGDAENDLKKVGRFRFNQKTRAWKESDESFAKHEPDGKGGCLERHTVVGSYQPNALGLYDMHGNVHEWCLDWGGDLLSGVTEPIGSSSGPFRVRRGGSWSEGADYCTSSKRGCLNPSCGYDGDGFRLFRTLSK